MMQFFAKALYPDLFADLGPGEKPYRDFYKKYLPVVPEGTFTVSLSTRLVGDPT